MYDMEDNVMSLENLGWNGFFENNAYSFDDPNLTPARIIGVRKNAFIVHDGDREILATAAGRLYHDDSPDSLFPAAGDWVLIRDTIIAHVLPRRNALSRGASGARHGRAESAVRGQVIAANLDTVFIVCGLDRDYNVRRIERYLTLIYNCGCSPVVILNKADLHPAPLDCAAEVESVAFGVPVFAVSAKSGQGVEVLRQFLPPGQTAALLGSSGAGKSTLVNQLSGAEVRAAKEVSEAVGKGVHTTTTRDIIPIPGAGMILDNPGIREIALWDDAGGIDDAFPDIQALAKECHYTDCTHEHEPGCRVREAVEIGVLKPARLQNYLKMQKELEFLNQRQEKSANRVEKERWKEIAIYQKQFKNKKRPRIR